MDLEIESRPDRGPKDNLVMGVETSHGFRANLFVVTGRGRGGPLIVHVQDGIMEKHSQAMDYSAFANVRQMLIDNATVPGAWFNQEGSEYKTHEEGLLNVRFLDE